jgi:FAD synthase
MKTLYKYDFESNIVKGIGKGKEIGFPTLNLETKNIPASFEYGVYICLISLESSNKLYNALMHYGTKSIGTDDFDKIFCEIHVIGFNDNFCVDFKENNNFFKKELNNTFNRKVKFVRVKLLKKIRNVRKFKSEKMLKKQIALDIKTAKRYFCHND